MLRRVSFAFQELDVPLQDDHIFPIGSNTKFFTAVAIYQLQEKGLLNVSDAVRYRLPAASRICVSGVIKALCGVLGQDLINLLLRR